jgi:hypothetical protein
VICEYGVLRLGEKSIRLGEEKIYVWEKKKSYIWEKEK